MNWIKEMITSPRGTVSSKRVIGSVSYIILTISVIVLCFVNPSFKNLDDILETLIFASTTMLGLTTFENVKNKTKKEEDNANQEIYEVLFITSVQKIRHKVFDYDYIFVV